MAAPEILLRLAVARLARTHPMHARLLTSGALQPTTSTSSALVTTRGLRLCIMFAVEHVAPLDVDQCADLLISLVDPLLSRGHANFALESARLGSSLDDADQDVSERDTHSHGDDDEASNSEGHGLDEDDGQNRQGEDEHPDERDAIEDGSQESAEEPGGPNDAGGDADVGGEGMDDQADEELGGQDGQDSHDGAGACGADGEGCGPQPGAADRGKSEGARGAGASGSTGARQHPTPRGAVASSIGDAGELGGDRSTGLPGASLPDGPARIERSSVVAALISEAWHALSPDELEVLAPTLRGHLTRTFGSTAALRQSVVGVTTSPKDWRKTLERFIAAVKKPEASYARPSRRLPELVGLVPGLRTPPARLRLMVVLDTSGSVKAAELSAMGRELRNIARHADVTLVECDTAVRRVTPFRGSLRVVSGRGGTDLRPPFAPDLLSRLRPDAMVFFTDGLGPAPARGPRVPVLWCLVGANRRPARWGRVARISSE